MNAIKIPFMNFMNLNKPKAKVGLDIGASAVKILMLTPLKEGGFEIGYFAVEPLDSNSSKEKIAELIKRVISGVDIKMKRVIVSVSGQGVVVRQVLFPVMTDEEFKSAIKFEAEKYIPFNVNDVYLDARIVDKQAPDRKIKVLIVAAKKELIEERISYLETAGLQAEVIDCDSIAVTNAFMLNNAALTPEKTISLLNIGAGMTNVCVLKNGALNFARDIPVEAANLDTLETQIRLSFDYYENQFGKGIDMIYVSGGGLKETGLLKRLSEAFGMEMLIWDPTEKLAVSPKVDAQALKEVSSRLAVCVGLATRR